jgi:hypothetical protein
MRTLIPSIAMLFASATVHAQDVTTVQATSSDISDNLDLQAVAAVFGEATDLDDFERRLNDPQLQICNLDLNADGFVDYLRVVETSQGGTHLVVIQAVLGQDVFQDVATVDVERDDRGTTRVQVVGDVYMYGPNYVIEPYYVQPPVIYVFFWGPRYRPWHSPYYWGYYPSYYSPWSPYPVYTYHQHVHVHIHRHPGNTYGYVGHRHSRVAGDMHRKMQRNDYAAQHPDRSFDKRNQGMTNRQALIEKREPARTDRPANVKENSKQTPRPVQQQWTPANGKDLKERQPAQSNDRKQTVPANGNDQRERQPAPSNDRKQTLPATRDQQTRPTQQPDSPDRTQPMRPATAPASRPERQAPTAPRTEQREQQKPTQAPRESRTEQRQSERPNVAPAARPERSRPERQAPAQRMEQKSGPAKAAPREAGRKERN